MATNAPMNLEMLQRVAEALGGDLERAVFVGGAVVSVYADDPAASEARPTYDIDLAVSVATAGELETLRGRLIAKGFTQSAADPVMCRFRIDGIMVDVMALEPVGWAPGNRWYASGFPKRESHVLAGGPHIPVLPLAYFLASKFDAHADRGGHSLASRDLEDIVHVLDNRLDIPSVWRNADPAVSVYLRDRLSWLVHPDQKEAVLGHMGFSASEARYQRMRREVRMAIGGL